MFGIARPRTPSNAGSLSRSRWAAAGAAIAVTLGAVGVGGYNLVSAEITSGDRPVFVPITPCRLMDTRPGPNNVGPRSTPIDSTPYVVAAHGAVGDCNIPTDAVALSANFTTLNANQPSFVTIWDEGPRPDASSLNPQPGQPATPNAVQVPLSGTGTFQVFNRFGTVDLIGDVNGYYADHSHLDDIDANLPVTVGVNAFDCNPLTNAFVGCTAPLTAGRLDRHSVMLVADLGWRNPSAGDPVSGRCHLQQDGVEIPGTEIVVGESVDTSLGDSQVQGAGINHVIFDDVFDNPGLTGFHEYRVACNQDLGSIQYFDIQLSILVVPERPGADF